MENKLNLTTVSRILRSSFTSCRSKQNSVDVIKENQEHYKLIDLFSPKDVNRHKVSDRKSLESNPKERRPKKPNRRKKRVHHSKDLSFSNDSNYYSLCSSDEDEETTLFSSSDSSGMFRRRRRSCGSGKSVRVKDSFAVVKRSSDPYNDFRTSMVEMIIERQIFGGKDLENLLQCFLSLNAECHHRVIVEVFTEIWETLFSDWF